MKTTKSAICLLAAALLLMLPVLPQAAADSNGWSYVYTGNGKTLNLREQPSTGARILARIPYGAAVWYLNDVTSTWGYIQYNGMQGYVMTKYIVNEKPAPFPAYPSGSSGSDRALPASTTGDLGQMNRELKTLRLVNHYTILSNPVRASGFVNLRFAPHAEAEIATICYSGHRLTVIAETANWYQVQDPTTGYVGYMMRKYTRLP